MMNLRPYQIPAVEALSRTFRGILKAPAGSGKTICGAVALNKWTGCQYGRSGPNPFQKVAWVANTTEQIDQAKAAVDKTQLWPVTLDYFCYQGCPSLAGYDLVILDECHHIAAPEYRKALTYHEGARWGLSATPDRSDELKQDVYELIGPIIYTIPREALVEEGQLAEAQVFVHSPNSKGEMERWIADTAAPELAARKARWPYLFFTPKGAQEQFNRILWQTALAAGIENNSKRNAKAVSLANDHVRKGDSILILVGKIEHGQSLALQISQTEVVFSKMGAKKRREAIQAFSNGELRCMIATSLADEGLDVPRANVLIQVSGGRSAAKAEQRTGRVLRAFKDGEHGENKTHGIIHEFSDLQHFFLAAQARKRFAVYERLGYKITHL